MAERDVSFEDVEREHLAKVHVGRHAAYVIIVVGAGFAGMLAVIFLLGGW